jgi:hypothetical protein
MYVKLKSWHISAGNSLTLCGRSFTGDDHFAYALPGDEKSCENCLRIQERRRYVSAGKRGF